jgi:hypothetical protein
MTATSSIPGAKPPQLVLSSARALQLEAEALKRLVEVYAQDRQPGCTFLTEQDAWKASPHHSQRAHRRRLWQHGMQLSRLIFANILDHMLSAGQLLSVSDSIVLYTHHTLARVVCEGAARIGFLLDPEISYDQRLLRSEVLALADADARIAATRDVAAAAIHPILSHAADEPIKQREYLLRRIEAAGITIRRNNGRPTHLEMGATTRAEPCKVDLTRLMEQAYPARPAAYRHTSGVVHSNPWVLNTTIASSPTRPELVLEPDIPGIGGATLTMIDASIIVIESYAKYYGHDPALGAHKSKIRAKMIDTLMCHWFTNPHHK